MYLTNEYLTISFINDKPCHNYIVDNAVLTVLQSDMQTLETSMINKMPKWRNWQTHTTQNLLREKPFSTGRRLPNPRGCWVIDNFIVSMVFHIPPPYPSKFQRWIMEREIEINLPMWRNWQTRRSQKPLDNLHAGSTPAIGTRNNRS